MLVSVIIPIVLSNLIEMASVARDVKDAVGLVGRDFDVYELLRMY